MPAHGIKLNLEFLGIVGAGALASYFLSGELVSNALFASLLVALFFLMGLHIDISKIRKELHRTTELEIGLFMAYFIVPAFAFGLAMIFGGGLADGLVAVGASTIALGSPVVFSNIGKGEDGTALVIAAASVVTGLLFVPLLVAFWGASVSLGEFAIKNFGLVFLPLFLGVLSQRWENRLFEDLKHHFSKLSLYLLVAVFLIQLRNLIGAASFSLSHLLIGIPVMALLVALSYVSGYHLSRLFGLSVPQSRSIGFTSGSKGLAVSLLIASVLSAEAVVYAAIYYFVRQAMLGTLAEYYAGNLTEPGTEHLKKVFSDWRFR